MYILGHWIFVCKTCHVNVQCHSHVSFAHHHCKHMHKCEYHFFCTEQVLFTHERKITCVGVRMCVRDSWAIDGLLLTLSGFHWKIIVAGSVKDCLQNKLLTGKHLWDKFNGSWLWRRAPVKSKASVLKKCGSVAIDKWTLQSLWFLWNGSVGFWHVVGAMPCPYLIPCGINDLYRRRLLIWLNFLKSTLIFWCETFLLCAAGTARVLAEAV